MTRIIRAADRDTKTQPAANFVGTVYADEVVVGNDSGWLLSFHDEAGKIIEDRESSNAFLADFRKGIAHSVAENHYRVLGELAAESRSAPAVGDRDGAGGGWNGDAATSRRRRGASRERR